MRSWPDPKVRSVAAGLHLSRICQRSLTEPHIGYSYGRAAIQTERNPVTFFECESIGSRRQQCEQCGTSDTEDGYVLKWVNSIIPKCVNLVIDSH